MSVEELRDRALAPCAGLGVLQGLGSLERYADLMGLMKASKGMHACVCHTSASFDNHIYTVMSLVTAKP